jgi:hypothetical protein
MSSYLQKYKSITSKYTKTELEHISRALNKSYNIYAPEEKMWRNLSYALGKTGIEELNDLRKDAIANQIINDLIFEYYHCERVVKYYFIKELLKLKNHIIAFEMNVKDSRVDICRINGDSYAYEIKTEYDAFDRLQTQLGDYSKIFDKVYLIVHKKMLSEALDQIPDNCGLITYTISGTGAKFKYVRKPKSNLIDTTDLVEVLSSSDSTTMLKMMGSNSIPSTRNERLDVIHCNYKDVQIKTTFKKLLKKKYNNRWIFVSNNFEKIIPIDIQSFFSSSLDPALAYYNTSFIIDDQT